MGLKDIKSLPETVKAIVYTCFGMFCMWPRLLYTLMDQLYTAMDLVYLHARFIIYLLGLFINSHEPIMDLLHMVKYLRRWDS